MAVAWEFSPGKKIRRTELHQQFGGQRQGGVSPSNQSPNVFLFSDPRSGIQHGYVDHWDGETFHYTGEGQRGEQRLAGGNKAILEHVERGRAIRVFKGARGVVEYVGEFYLDQTEPWYTTDAPETGGGPIRSVIVFRLHPVGTPNIGSLPLPGFEIGAQFSVVAIEENNTEKFLVDPNREKYEAERRESALVRTFLHWIGNQEPAAARLRIMPDGEAKPIFSDIWLPSKNLLIEAKGTCTREAVRMAIGQLVDYGRFQPEARRAVLLPAKPRADLCKLLASVGVGCFWPDPDGFQYFGPII